MEALEILLVGLCGAPKHRVRVHELCLKSGPNIGLSSILIFKNFAFDLPWKENFLWVCIQHTNNIIPFLIYFVVYKILPI